MQPNNSELKYESKDKVLFIIREQATRRDQSEMNIAMGAQTSVEDGKTIKTNFLALFPWLFERFVIGWSGGNEKTGREILNRIYEQPADPVEDLVMVTGSYIFNHVKGLTHHAEDQSKKKD